MSAKRHNGTRPIHKRSLLSPNKTSVWAAMIMHDQMKFREEELLKQERQRREQADLRKFYHSQIEHKLREENKLEKEKKKHESETIQRGKLEKAQEEARIKFKRYQWQQTARNQYLKSLDRSGLRLKGPRVVQTTGLSEYWPYEREFIGTNQKQKQKQHLHDLSEIICENQLMRKKQKQLQHREDQEYLEFVNAKETYMRKKIAEEMEAREEMFKLKGNNHSMMEQIKTQTLDSRHARIASEMKKQEQVEDTKKKLRQASLKSDLLEKLAEMNEQRYLQNELLKLSTKREGEEARKRAEEFQQQMADERRRYLEKKEKQKKEMMQQMRDNVEEKRIHKQLDLLNKREFGLNKYKLMEMGIFDEIDQAAVAGDFTLRRQEMLSSEHP